MKITVLVFSASLTVFCADSTFFTGETLFADYFQDGNDSGWIKPEGGPWVVEGSEYSCGKDTSQSFTGHLMAYHKSESVWRNYCVKADIKVIDDIPGGWGALTFRIQDSANYYSLQFEPNSSKLQLSKRKGFSPTMLTEKSFSFQKGIWYGLKVVVKGDTINGYVNDSLLITYRDMSYSSGSAGVIAFYAHCHFDNFIAICLENHAPRFVHSLLKSDTLWPTLCPYSATIHAQDQENDSIAYSLLISPQAMSINSQTGCINWLPLDTGYSQVKVMGIDPHGASDSFNFHIRTYKNLPPSFTSQVQPKDTIVFADSVYSTIIFASDPNNDSLKYSLLNPSSNMTVDSLLGQISWHTNKSDTGACLINVTAKDPYGLSDTLTYTLHVYYNHPPLFLSSPDTITYEGYRFTYIIKVQDSDTEAVRCSLATPISNLTLSNDTLLFQPTKQQIGTHNITIKALDERGATTNQTFRLHVCKGNGAISLIALIPTNDTTITENDTICFRASATSQDTSAPISYAWSLKDVTVDRTSQYTLRTDYKSAGICTVTVSAYDGHEIEEHSWLLTIQNKALAPLTLKPIDASPITGDSSLTWKNMDPDLDSTQPYYRVMLYRGTNTTNVLATIDSIRQSFFKIQDRIKPNILPKNTVISWKVMAYDAQGHSTPFSTLLTFNYVDDGISIEQDIAGLSADYELLQNTPNPFNPSTTIRFAVPAKTHDFKDIFLNIYNVKGLLVKSFAFPNAQAGRYAITWDARDFNHLPCAAGLYICKLQAHELNKEIKMLLTK